MKLTQTNPKVDDFLLHETKWKEEFTALRALILESELTEELKWGQPTYSLKGKNVLLIHGFKEYCAILFVKGALMQDSQGILIQQTKKVQAARQIRFKNLQQILDRRDVLKAYIQDAIDNEVAGKEVEMKKTTEFPMPEELQIRLYNKPELKVAFETLTPGRQRAYLLYFSDPKQVKTREARIDKYIDQIMDGKGLYD